jgi:predicted Zn-dependent protease with MMP-like domain
MEKEEFEKLVQAGLDEIPKKFLKKLKNISVVVEDEPTAEQRIKLRLKKRDGLFGLYEGIPLTDRSSGYFGVLPDKITIFKKELESVAKDEEDLKTLVKETVWHEVAHHFGMSEEEVKRRERERRSD